MRCIAWILFPALVLSLTSCAARPPVPRTPAKPTGVLEVREGLASYYGQSFNGQVTASGIRFDMHAMVAAHPTYPMSTRSGTATPEIVQPASPTPPQERQLPRTS